LPSRSPVLDDVRYVTLAHHLTLNQVGFDILVGYKNKVSICCHLPPSPSRILMPFHWQRVPQVWTLVPRRNGAHILRPASVRLQLAGELSGPGYFSGDKHQMISCVDNGTIYFCFWLSLMSS